MINLLLLAGISSVVQANTIAVCETGINSPAGKLLHSTSVAGKDLQIMLLADPGMIRGCRSLKISLGEDSVLWTRLIVAEPPAESNSRIILQGNFDDDNPLISEIIIPQFEAPAPAATPPLPFNENIISQFNGSIFGSDGRASLRDDHLLVCKSGDSSAGAIFRTVRTWRSGNRQTMELVLSGSGEITLALSDAQREALEAPLIVDKLLIDTAPADATDELVSFEIPLPESADNWTSFTLLCPQGQVTINIEQLSLVPRTREPVSYS